MPAVIGNAMYKMFLAIELLVKSFTKFFSRISGAC